jgi:hypothetical protein
MNEEKGIYLEEGRNKTSYNNEEWGRGSKLGQYISCV